MNNNTDHLNVKMKFIFLGWKGLACESQCPKGLYGKDCQSKCKCQNGGYCYPATGHCTCPPGFYGDSCDKTCPVSISLTVLDPRG